MAICFKLVSKITGQPEPLVRVDEAICEHLGVTPDPIEYHAWWFDSIGFKLASGLSFSECTTAYEKLRDENPGDEWPVKMLKIVAFLQTRYDPVSWRDR